MIQRANIVRLQENIGALLQITKFKQFVMTYGLLIRWYFRFTWVLGIHPISLGFAKPNNDKSWSVMSRWPHQIYCGVVWVAHILARITGVRENFYYPVDNPLAFFWAARYLFSFWRQALYKWIGYHKHRQLKDIFKFLEVSMPSRGPLPFPVWLATLVAVGLGIASLASVPLNVVRDSVKKNATFSQQVKFNAQHGKWRLFIVGTKETNITSFDPSDEYSGDEMALATFHVAIKSIGYLHTSFVDYFMFAIVGSMWMATRGYCKYFKDCIELISVSPMNPKALVGMHDVKVFRGPNTRSINIVELQGTFQEFKEFFKRCNDVISSSLLLFNAECILLYATTLNDLFQFKGNTGQFSSLFRALLCIMVLWMSADTHKQMIYLCTVIGDEIETCDNKLRIEYKMLLNVVERTKLGVSVWGCFNMTFSGFFQIIYATLTYYLLVVGKEYDDVVVKRKA